MSTCRMSSFDHSARAGDGVHFDSAFQLLAALEVELPGPSGLGPVGSLALQAAAVRSNPMVSEAATFSLGSIRFLV